MAVEASIGIKLREEDNKLFYELRSSIGTPIKICIDKSNYVAETIRYKKPGDKGFDTLLAASVIGINKYINIDDNISEFPNGYVNFEIVCSMNYGLTQRISLFLAGLKSEVIKTLQLEG